MFSWPYELLFTESGVANVPVHDLQRHLLGGSVFINSRTEYALSGGLTQAAFWVFVLQDVQFSLAYQRPLKMQTLPFSLEFRQRWQYENGGSEQSLIHRAIWILVETIQLFKKAEDDCRRKYSLNMTIQILLVEHSK